MSSSFGPSKARLLELSKLSKQIFHESFNPTQARRGSRVLRAPLKGDVLTQYYYPNDFLKFKYLQQQFPELYLVDAKEQYRLHINQEYVLFILPLTLTTNSRFLADGEEARVHRPKRLARRLTTRPARRRNKLHLHNTPVNKTIYYHFLFFYQANQS